MWGKLAVFLSLAFQVAASVVSLRLFKVPRRHPCVFLIAGVMILIWTGHIGLPVPVRLVGSPPTDAIHFGKK